MNNSNNDDFINAYPQKLTRRELILVVESFLNSNDFTIEKGYPTFTLGHDITLERVLELRNFLIRKGFTNITEQYEGDRVILPIGWLSN